MKRLIFGLCCLVLLLANPFLLLGMDGRDVPKKAAKLFKQSKQEFIYENYAEAKKLLQKAIKVYPKYRKAYVQLGEIHHQLNEFQEAKAAYEKVLKLNKSPKSNFLAIYKIGQLERDMGNYAAAIQRYKTCQKMLLNMPKYMQDRADRLAWELENLEFAHHAIKNPVLFDPVRLDSTINSPHDEYLPMMTADEEVLVFTRRINSDREPNEDFYYSHKTEMDSAEMWKMAIAMREPINTESNEGAICISPDGKRMFFAAKDRRRGLGGFDLYYCIKKGKKWHGPFNMGHPVNTIGWESQPSISADGRSLYFCSRRKGGKGGIDIWVTHLQDDNYWSKPENLGDAINTKKNEQSPFIHPDNETLYFSSDGHIGMGDTDLYVVRKDEEGKWGKAENLGYPINTTGNENGLIVTASGERAFFSSYHEGSGLDLFYFSLPKKAKPIYVTYVKGNIYDTNTKEKLSATIELIDLETGKEVIKTKVDPLSGEFLVTLPVGKNYMYNVSKTNYLFHSENFSLEKHDHQKPYLLDIYLKPILKPVPVVKETPKPKAAPKSKRKPAPKKATPKVIPMPKAHPAPKKEPVVIAKTKPTPPPKPVVEPAKKEEVVSYEGSYDLNVGESVVLKNVFFEVNSAELKPASYYELNKVVDLLYDYTTLKIEIGGHTDNTGEADYNLKLSNKRAKSVYDYLASKGADPMRMTYKGYGESQPIADNNTDAGRAENRRTNFTIIDQVPAQPKKSPMASSVLDVLNNPVKNLTNSFFKK